jgi:hypothetical protein
MARLILETAVAAWLLAMSAASSGCFGCGYSAGKERDEPGLYREVNGTFEALGLPHPVRLDWTANWGNNQC